MRYSRQPLDVAVSGTNQERDDSMNKTFFFFVFSVVIVVWVQMTRHFFVENVRKFLDQLP